MTERAYWLPLFSDLNAYAFAKDLDFKTYPDELPRFYFAKWKCWAEGMVRRVNFTRVECSPGVGGKTEKSGEKPCGIGIRRFPRGGKFGQCYGVSRHSTPPAGRGLNGGVSIEQRGSAIGTRGLETRTRRELGRSGSGSP